MESPTSPEQFREIQNFIECQRPDNTSKKTTYDINVIERYFESINEKREIENIPPKELNIQLAKFFMNVRKKMATFMSQILSRTTRGVYRDI